jgi:apolipoprotein D and lipocalin family protein
MNLRRWFAVAGGHFRHRHPGPGDAATSKRLTPVADFDVVAELHDNPRLARTVAADDQGSRAMDRQLHKITSVPALLALLLAGCTGAPEGVEPVSGFELDRYLGTWYEIARLDHRFERGLSNVTATYSLRDDGGVKVINRGYDSAAKEWDEADGKAYFVGDKDIGQLKVSFFGPFYGGYNVIALDKDDYQYSMVAGPDRSYLWILSRTPELDDAILDTLLSKAGELGFPLGELIMVDHESPPPAAVE